MTHYSGSNARTLVSWVSPPCTAHWNRNGTGAAVFWNVVNNWELHNNTPALEFQEAKRVALAVLPQPAITWPAHGSELGWQICNQALSAACCETPSKHGARWGRVVRESYTCQTDRRVIRLGSCRSMKIKTRNYSPPPSSPWQLTFWAQKVTDLRRPGM